MTIPTKTYTHSTAASALFFKNTDKNKAVHQALRVEVPEIGKEFSDNAYIGTDPDGIFYYMALSDLTGKVKAKVLKVTQDSKTYAHVKFYTSDDTKPYAEFVAEDPNDVVSTTGMVDYTKNGLDGSWADINIGTATATIYKKSSEAAVTVTAASISKTATITSTGDFSTTTAVDTKGTLYFKKVGDLTSTKGKYASYNNDRIVFYEDDYTGKDFVAYFIPFEGSTALGSSSTVVYSDVTWA